MRLLETKDCAQNFLRCSLAQHNRAQKRSLCNSYFPCTQSVRVFCALHSAKRAALCAAAARTRLDIVIARGSHLNPIGLVASVAACRQFWFGFACGTRRNTRIQSVQDRAGWGQAQLRDTPFRSKTTIRRLAATAAHLYNALHRYPGSLRAHVVVAV